MLDTTASVTPSVPASAPPAEHAPDSLQHSAVQVYFESKTELYASFMPFIKHGGLFIQTKKNYQLGDDVFVLLKLLDELEKFPLTCKVVWHTPIGAQSGLVAGIGVQFPAESEKVRKKIETYLAGMLDSDNRTDTM